MYMKVLYQMYMNIFGTDRCPFPSRWRVDSALRRACVKIVGAQSLTVARGPFPQRGASAIRPQGVASWAAGVRGGEDAAHDDP